MQRRNRARHANHVPGAPVLIYSAPKRTWWPVVMAVLAVQVVVMLTLSIVNPARSSAAAESFVSLAPQFATASDPFAGSPFILQRVPGYADIATSSKVLAAVITELGLSQTPDSLRPRVTSMNIPNTVILRVVVTDHDPQRAATIANAIAAQQARTIESIEAGNANFNSPVSVVPIPAVTAARPNAFARFVGNALAGLVAGLIVVLGGLFVHRHRRSDGPARQVDRGQGAGDKPPAPDRFLARAGSDVG